METNKVQWTGTFQSEMYPPNISCGKISFLAPSTFLDTTEVIDVTLSYTGQFRKGAEVQMYGRVSEKTLVLQTPSGCVNQVISLNIRSVENDQISGSYTSTGVADYGSFKIHMANDTTGITSSSTVCVLI